MNGLGQDVVLARATARFLAAAGTTLGTTSLVLAAVALAALALGEFPHAGWLWTSVVVAAGAAERTLRVRMDASLFEDLAAQAQAAGAPVAAGLAVLDVALAKLFPRRMLPAGRPLEARVDRSRRVAYVLATLVALQAALLLGALFPG